MLTSTSSLVAVGPLSTDDVMGITSTDVPISGGERYQRVLSTGLGAHRSKGTVGPVLFSSVYGVKDK